MIPSVEFNSSTPDDGLIEILDIDDLNQRRSTMDHSPGNPHRIGFSMLLIIKEGMGTHFVDFVEWVAMNVKCSTMTY